MTTSPRTVADVTDPGIAAGPLAALLRHGRDELAVDLADRHLAATAAARPYLLALLAERARPLLVVAARTADATTIADGLAAFLGEDQVAVFPAWETLPLERLSPQPATVGQRLRVIDRLCCPDAYPAPLLAVVAPVRAALQPMDPALGRRRPIYLDRHWRDGFDGLVERLAALGYSRAPQVEARGEFAVRGGIVDLFPTAADHAVRVEFWGDDLDSMRTFAVADQRSIEPVKALVIDPARELVLDDELRDRARARARSSPRLREPLEQLADGLTFEGAESLATFIHPCPALLPAFFPDGSGVALVDPIVTRQRAEKLRDEAAVLMEVGWDRPGRGGSQAPSRQGGPGGGLTATSNGEPHEVGFADVDRFLDATTGPVWELDPFGAGALPGRAWDSFRGDLEALARRVRGLLTDGQRVVVTTTGHGPAQRLADILGEHAIPTKVSDQVAVDPPPGRVEITASSLHEGLLADELGLALLAEWDVFGPRRRQRAGRRMGTRRSAGDTVLDLEDGDHVVHRTHGVGVFRGMVTRQITGPSGDRAIRDYVVLEYADADTLFVPSDQVDAIAKYVGGEKPSVMTLGGAQWERAKNRVRKAVRDIASELIRLYAARMHAPGTAFAPDSTWQGELEDAFEHPETPDQLTVIDEIKQDMEAPLPMDRLLCGDVGFGKTEVAVRAAAKAIFDGKQVGVLVPTTILAQQHFETFRERFAGFPVQLRMLSRFVTDGERRVVLDGVAAGTVDLVVGTHALLGKTVQWKDLGLVIVDEEQRFGVAQKERLKQLRTSVDVLTMSATPIPRTMEMAISGIRDLSVIETPPEDRQPVVTVVQPYDDAQIALAIRRELLRDGQVFFVHNQVSTISSAAVHVKELVPDAKVEVAHGQMDERELERVMVRFWQRELDVLVCTTIIESGLDIPSANTLIIERADLLGLAQLHQLRGRVGRSSERGYAYFFFPEGASITEPAYERLKTVAEHTRLGAGLAIAARDLEIRGAGNVVGAEQSGHVAAVGFDMYSQLLKEEVADLTGEAVEPEVDIRLELPVDAHLPAHYVADDKQRLELYQRIASVRDAGGVRAVRAELADRFGPLPPPADRLLTLTALKAALRRWGVTDVSITPRNKLRIAPAELSAAQQVRLERLHPHATWQPDTSLLLVPVPRGTHDVVAWVARTLRELFA